MFSIIGRYIIILYIIIPYRLQSLESNTISLISFILKVAFKSFSVFYYFYQLYYESVSLALADLQTTGLLFILRLFLLKFNEEKEEEKGEKKEEEKAKETRLR